MGSSPSRPCLACAMLSGHAVLSWQIDTYLQQSLPGVNVIEPQFVNRADEKFRASPFAATDLKRIADVFIKDVKDREKNGERIKANLAVPSEDDVEKDLTSSVLFWLETNVERRGGNPEKGTGTTSGVCRKLLKNHVSMIREFWLYFPKGVRKNDGQGSSAAKWFRIMNESERNESRVPPSWHFKCGTEDDSVFALVVLLAI